MFWVFDGDELQPRSVLDGALGEEEFLECSLEDSSELMVPDFWRMSPAGMATIVRSYREDRRHPVSTRSRMAAAAWAEASRFFRGRPQRLAEPVPLLAGEEPLVLLDPEAGHAPARVAAGGTPAPRIRQVEHLDQNVGRPVGDGAVSRHG